MISPTERRRVRRRFKDSEGYEKVLDKIQDNFPSVEVEKVRVVGGTFSTPGKRILVEFTADEDIEVTMSGRPSGGSVLAEVTDKRSETRIIHTYMYRDGSLDTDSLDFSEINS